MSQDDRNRMKQIREEIINETPNSWQGMVAKFNAISELSFEGKDEDLIQMAQDALKNWDFTALEKENSDGMRAIKVTTGNHKNLFREALKGMLANALCNKGLVSEAKTVLQTIQDSEFAEITRKRIQLAEKAERERTLLKEAREKPWKGKGKE